MLPAISEWVLGEHAKNAPPCTKYTTCSGFESRGVTHSTGTLPSLLGSRPRPAGSLRGTSELNLRRRSAIVPDESQGRTNVRVTQRVVIARVLGMTSQHHCCARIRQPRRAGRSP